MSLRKSLRVQEWLAVPAVVLFAVAACFPWCTRRYRCGQSSGFYRSPSIGALLFPLRNICFKRGLFGLQPGQQRLRSV